MAKIIKSIITDKGAAQYDYHSLANLPNGITKEYAVSNSNVRPEGTTFQKKTNAVGQRMRTICYGNGVHIAAGLSGDVQISKDRGKTWTAITKFSNNEATVSITFGQGKFVCLDSSGHFYTSTDGENWRKLDFAMTFASTTYAEAIGYGDGKFIAVGGLGTICVSHDGEYFSQLPALGSFGFTAITYGAGKYLAVADNGAIFQSFDGYNWMDVTPAETTGYRTVCWSGDKFLIGGTAGVIKYSTDGINWTNATTNSTTTIAHCRAILCHKGYYYSVHYTAPGVGELWTSADGKSWELGFNLGSANTRLWCLGAGDDVVITGADNGGLYVLDCKVEWLKQEPTISGGQYLWERVILESEDGTLVGEPVVNNNLSRLYNLVAYLAEQSNISIEDVTGVYYNSTTPIVNTQNV